MTALYRLKVAAMTHLQLVVLMLAVAHNSLCTFLNGLLENAFQEESVSLQSFASSFVGVLSNTAAEQRSIYCFNLTERGYLFEFSSALDMQVFLSPVFCVFSVRK